MHSGQPSSLEKDSIEGETPVLFFDQLVLLL